MEKLFAILFGVGGVGIISYFLSGSRTVGDFTIDLKSFMPFNSEDNEGFKFISGGKSSVENDIIKEAREGVRAELIEKEGYRNTVYLDTRGLATVGIGHLVLPSDNLKVGDTISDARVEQFYSQDSAKAFGAAISQARELGRFTAEFIIALTSVNYQLGTGWKYTFKNTYAKLKRGDYQSAINNLRQSNWAKQTPVRVAEFTRAIENAYTTAA